MSRRKDRGFTAVELVITIIVGVMFIIAISQIYGVVLSDAGYTRNKANANAIAYSEARRILATVWATCVASTPAASLPTSPVLPKLSTGNPTIAASITCPFSSNTAVSRVTVTIEYGSPKETVKHVLYAY